MVAVHSRLMVAATPGAVLMGASPSPTVSAFASESGVEWLNRDCRLRRTPTDEAPWVRANVVSVDAREARLTIAHEAIPAIDMPAMTMAFPVSDTALLDQARAGTSVEAQAADRGGVVRIVIIRPSR